MQFNKVCLHIFRNLKYGGCQTLALSIIENSSDLKHIVVYLNDDDEMLNDFQNKVECVSYIDQKKGASLVSKYINELIFQYRVTTVISWFYPYTLRLNIESKCIINHVGMACLPFNKIQFYKNFINYIMYRSKIKNQITVFASNHIKKTFEKYIYPNINSYTIYNGVAINKYNISVCKKKNSIIMIGRLDGSKDFDTYIKLSNDSRFIDCQFYIAGDGSDRVRLSQLNDRLGGKVQFLGTVKNIPDILSWIDISIFLNKNIEGFGNVLIEAMASNCIVISNNLGASKEIITNESDGFLVNNYHELSNKLLEIIELKIRKNEVLNMSLKKVKNKFDINHTVNKYMDLLK